MEIPYSVGERPDTGLYNAKLAMWLFLASEVMLFGGLFSSYLLLRLGAPDWPVAAEILDVPMATLNSVLLILSSVTIVKAWQALGSGSGSDSGVSLSRYRWFMLATIALGLVFLVIKGVEYRSKIDHGLLPSSNNFMGIYFALTGLHALHLIGGVVANLFLVGPAVSFHHRQPERFRQWVECAGIYWHFVDLVWIVLFPALYLI
jgi:heme/copper-type cytochrome/quinol oxidase subunit 3